MKLSEHLIAKTQPLANTQNMVFWKDYRVSVLQDRLFRIEKNPKKKFRDDATQTVWFRNMPKQNFTVECSADFAVIQTSSVRLILRKKFTDCRIVTDKEYPLTNAENLGGTYRTLDVCNGNKFCDFVNNKRKNIRLGNGVCSKNGIAYFDDAKSLTLGKDGEIKPERGAGKDVYLFCYGTDYREAVKALYLITGAPPSLPRFAFGNWWSRFYRYTDEEYLRLLNKFSDRNVPLTVATVDMDWHYSFFVDEEKGITAKGRDTDFYGGKNGWTGYSWNVNLFPDHKKFLKEVADRNLKITLNLHPADGIRWWEDQYENMAKALGKNPETCEKIEFDFSSTQFIDRYFPVMLHTHEEDGVDFWWVDWQQGTQSKTAGLDPLWSLNHYHYLDCKRKGEQALILSRFSGIGSHRYPVGFSGDTVISWETLKYLPYFTATASNIGYTYWSHDIGGHMLGTMSQELYLRHIQYGVFSPINRLHCSDEGTTTKEPWAYGNGAGRIAEDYLRFRHRMIPHLYTLSQKTHKEGIAIVEPLYYEWQNPIAYEMKEEYIFGENFLVVPVTSPLKKDGYARVQAWLPEGEWTDIFTGDEYTVSEKDGVKKTLLRKLEDIPVLAKAGSFLVLSSDQGNVCKNPKNLETYVFNGNGEFTLYEDGKAENKAGEVLTKFTSRLEKGEKTCTQTVCVCATGKANVLPKNRTLKLSFRNIKTGKVQVRKNGKHCEAKTVLSDCLRVEFALEKGVEYEISVSFTTQSKLQKLLERAKEVLTQTEGDNVNKFWNGWKALEQAKTVEEYVNLMQYIKVGKEAKERLLETL